MTQRRQARELALQALYAYRIHQRDIDELIEDLATESSLGPETVEFSRRLIETVIKNIDILDEEITRLADNWELERIAIIDRIILRMALTEMRFMPDIPVKVAINEAIDMAKKYSTLESSSFVNGILDAAISESDSP